MQQPPLWRLRLFCVAVTFEIEPSAFKTFVRRVRKQANDSLTLEPLCHWFDVLVADDLSARVFLYELYEDREAFDAHLRSAHFLAFDVEVTPMVVNKSVLFWRQDPGQA